MATFSVSFSHEVSPPATKRDFLVVAHNKEFFTSLKITSHLSVIAQLDDAELELIHHAAEHKLTQAAENVSSIELSFKVDGDKPGMRKFVFGILPSECSRINSSTRAHSISAFVKAQRGASANLFVYIVPKDLKHCLAQAVAAARAFPTFTRKTTGSPIASSFHIVLEPPFHIVESKIFTHEIESVINGVRLAQRLVDTPPNILHTSAYFSEVQATIERLHNPYAKIHTFIQGGDLEDAGFGGIWNVGKASEHPPVFVALSYLPPLSETKPVIALVGKGIVYDTGGLQIKTPGANMATMKTDMGGSAAVLGAFEALVANGSQIPVYALLCIAENSISAASFRNDDIITLLSGKTVEVNNTDAEGRLVLSDGVFFAASTLKASIIIDIATLTGAQPISTGKNHAGIYCSDEDLENVAVKVGKETGDLVFPLPYCPEFYRKEFSSQVADMKNSVADRSNAQSSCAAQFIGNHLEVSQ